MYCDECAEKNGWAKTDHKSRGRCEICHKEASCNVGMASGDLPLSKDKMPMK